MSTRRRSGTTDSPWFPRSALAEAVSLARARSLLWRTATDINTIFKISPDVQKFTYILSAEKKNLFDIALIVPNEATLEDPLSLGECKVKPFDLTDLTIQQKLTSHYSTAKNALDIMHIFT